MTPADDYCSALNLNKVKGKKHLFEARILIGDYE